MFRSILREGSKSNPHLLSLDGPEEWKFREKVESCVVLVATLQFETKNKEINLLSKEQNDSPFSEICTKPRRRINKEEQATIKAMKRPIRITYLLKKEEPRMLCLENRQQSSPAVIFAQLRTNRHYKPKEEILVTIKSESVLWCTTIIASLWPPVLGENALGIPQKGSRRPWRPRCSSVCACLKELKGLITPIFVTFNPC